MRIPEKAQMTHSNKVCQSKEEEHDRRRSANANAIAADLSVCHVHAWPAVSQDSSHQDDIRPGNDNPVCNCVDVPQTSRTLNRVAGTRRKKSHGVKLCSHEFHPSSFNCSSFQSGVHCRTPINSHTHTLHHPQLIENGIFFFFTVENQRSGETMASTKYPTDKGYYSIMQGFTLCICIP